MKYTAEIEINKPNDRVIELFDKPDNMYKWMGGLQSFDPAGGSTGQPGAKLKQAFKMGKRDIEMTETISARNLLHEFTGNYEAKAVFNIKKNSFQKMDDNNTRYISEQEFKCTGFMKCITFLMPGAFKKQSMKHLSSFKNSAESN